MKVNVTDSPKTYDGEAVFVDDSKTKIANWRYIIFVALNSETKEHPLSIDDKKMSYEITKKIYDSNEPDITIEEASYILKRVPLVFNALVYGRTMELLEDR